MIFFVADIHLSSENPATAALFAHFLRHRAREAKALYILGDLFNVWVGDDDLSDPFHLEVADLLANTTAAGLPIYLQHGNRDFLLGADFAKATGTVLLPETHVISTPTEQFVISHGDHLCLDDAAYRAFRSQVRDADWQKKILAMPLDQRRVLGNQIRLQSEVGQAGQYRDLEAAATDDFLRAHGYATFIHGHTHLPACHDHLVDGIYVRRFVLADWREENGVAKGEVLVLDADSETLDRESLTTL